MATVQTSLASIETLADVLERIGDVPLDRIRSQPPPGTARVKDVIAARRSPERRLCELVDGVLVEKTLGFQESLLATILVKFLWTFVEVDDRGIVLGADGTLRLLPGLVRIPDVCFISWDRLPGRGIPSAAIPHVVPDLAVEVLSKSNTRKEMERKLRDYFTAGVRLVWLVDPRTRTVDVYTAPETSHRLRNGQTLDGGEVLPGFTLPLRQLFARAGRR